jgi:ATP-dependent Clp protease ATP-binding subunit ClpB
VYRRLGREQIRRIVDIQLEGLRARLEERELELEVTDAAKDFLAEVGWDPQFGARPLKRAIQRHLEDGLARRLLAGDFKAGDRISVNHGPGGDLTFERRPTGTRPTAEPVTRTAQA